MKKYTIMNGKKKVAGTNHLSRARDYIHTTGYYIQYSSAAIAQVNKVRGLK